MNEEDWKEWNNLVDYAKEQLQGNCPLIDDEIVVKVDNEIKRMLKKLNSYQSILNGDYS